MEPDITIDGIREIRAEWRVGFLVGQQLRLCRQGQAFKVIPPMNAVKAFAPEGVGFQYLTHARAHLLQLPLAQARLRLSH
jgi:hypothetical protein